MMIERRRRPREGLVLAAVGDGQEKPHEGLVLATMVSAFTCR